MVRHRSAGATTQRRKVQKAPRGPFAAIAPDFLDAHGKGSSVPKTRHRYSGRRIVDGYLRHSSLVFVKNSDAIWMYSYYPPDFAKSS